MIQPDRHNSDTLRADAAGRRGVTAAGRRAVTLVELLVVIAIMALLIAAGVPAVRHQNEGRKIREAARSINVFFGAARNRALETGRPCGVMLRPYETTASVMLLEQVEVPPAFGGQLMTSMATITGSGNTITAQLSDSLPPNMIYAGDMVQLNYQGPMYTITSAVGNSFTATIDLSPGQLLPWGSQPSASVPYRILRRPIKSVASPLQLPGGAVIDLTNSGTDGGNFGGGPVVIMFAPSGSLQRIYIGSNPPEKLNRRLYLLVGLLEKEGGENLNDLGNLWVTLNPQSGMVTTNRMAPADHPDGPRGLAKQARSMGEQ